ncbi:hypothetical protein OROGR_015583 [Orobanche gracilis]
MSDGSIDQIVVTASKDTTLRLWKFGIEESLNQPKKIRAFRILRGHTAAVQSIEQSRPLIGFVPDLGIVLSSYGTSMLPSLVVV